MGSRDDRNINRVILKDNDMRAYVNLSAPDDGGEYSIDEILDLLRKNGVREGINRSRISAIIKKHIYNTEQMVAEGTPPVDGVDGYFEYFFKPSGGGKKSPPLIREDGTVDYTSVNVIECVSVGDKLAVYHPAIKEKPGINVKGKPMPGRRAKELMPLRCTGCTYKEEELAYYADIEGRVDATKAKLTVTGLQEINHDIDLVFGDINFKGDVIIHGSVSEGVTINATRSVTINGVFHGKSIYAGEDIIVKGGILGVNSLATDTIEMTIECGGDLMADFIQYADIKANGSVSANYILDSRIVANDMVHATGEKGSIVGGDTYGMRGVDAKFLGNDVLLKTIVASGVRENVTQRRKQLAKDEKTQTERLEEMQRRSDEIERNVRLGSANEGMMQERQTIMREKIEVKASLQAIQQKGAELDELIKAANGSAVRAYDTAFEGVVIMVDSQQYVVEDNKRAVEFVRDNEGNLLPFPLASSFTRNTNFES